MCLCKIVYYVMTTFIFDIVYTLNLIVQERLKLIKVASLVSLHWIRESIKYVKSSEPRNLIFAKCVEQVKYEAIAVMQGYS